jgi:hypothetical protein
MNWEGMSWGFRETVARESEPRGLAVEGRADEPNPAPRHRRGEGTFDDPTTRIDNFCQSG